MTEPADLSSYKQLVDRVQRTAARRKAQVDELRRRVRELESMRTAYDNEIATLRGRVFDLERETMALRLWIKGDRDIEDPDLSNCYRELERS